MRSPIPSTPVLLRRAPIPSCRPPPNVTADSSITSTGPRLPARASYSALAVLKWLDRPNCPARPPGGHPGLLAGRLKTITPGAIPTPVTKSPPPAGLTPRMASAPGSSISLIQGLLIGCWIATAKADQGSPSQAQSLRSRSRHRRLVARKTMKDQVRIVPNTTHLMQIPFLFSIPLSHLRGLLGPRLRSSVA